MPKNICNCPSPPGGQIECDGDHAAFCVVTSEGAFKGLCLPLPQSARATGLFGISQLGAALIMQNLPRRLHADFSLITGAEAGSYVQRLMSQPAGTSFPFFFRSVGLKLTTSLPR